MEEKYRRKEDLRDRKGRGKMKERIKGTDEVTDGWMAGEGEEK